MQKNFVFSLPALMLAFFCSIIFIGCNKDDDNNNNVQGPDVNFYALTANNQLLQFNGTNVSTAQATMSITGLQSGETILGIDFRPNTGQLFGVGSSSRLYIINRQTGAATAVGTAAFTTPLSGTTFGFDFNPTVDRIRLVSNTGQNLRLNPETGGIAATDGTINGAAGASITSVAYTQNRAGAVSTVLYDIDVANNKLYRQIPPNDGALVEVGNLGVDAEAASGFDISSDSAYALAVLTVGGTSGLYTINLNTGAAIKVGSFGVSIIGLAIPTAPTAYAVSTTNNLLIVNPNNGDISLTKPIMGLQTGENILGIDIRPATGQLFGLGSSGRLYSIATTSPTAPASAMATSVSAAVFTTPLSGTDFGFDFNPTVDRIRVVSNTGQNLRLNPIDGTVAAVDSTIRPTSFVVSAAAYTNNFAGATSTILYDIDAQTDRLVRQDNPNGGTIVDIGALGVNVDAANGFDISSVNGVAIGIFTVSGTTRFYNVNLTTGAATAGPQVNQSIRGFALGIGL